MIRVAGREVLVARLRGSKQPEEEQHDEQQRSGQEDEGGASRSPPPLYTSLHYRRSLRRWVAITGWQISDVTFVGGSRGPLVPGG